MYRAVFNLVSKAVRKLLWFWFYYRVRLAEQCNYIIVIISNWFGFGLRLSIENHSIIVCPDTRSYNSLYCRNISVKRGASKMHPRPNISVSTLHCIQDIYQKINLKILDNLILLFVVSHFVLEKLTLFQGLNPHSAFLHPETKSTMYFYSILDGVVFHHRVIPGIKFAEHYAFIQCHVSGWIEGL